MVRAPGSSKIRFFWIFFFLKFLSFSQFSQRWLDVDTKCNLFFITTLNVCRIINFFLNVYIIRVTWQFLKLFMFIPNCLFFFVEKPCCWGAWWVQRRISETYRRGLLPSVPLENVTDCYFPPSLSLSLSLFLTKKKYSGSTVEELGGRKILEI